MHLFYKKAANYITNATPLATEKCKTCLANGKGKYNERKKEIEISYFDFEGYDLPDESGTSMAVFFTLKIGERELDVRGDACWEFSPSQFYDDENCCWFESWGFTISAGVTVFEEEEILCDRTIELDGMNLYYLDISVFEENDEGEPVQAEWEAYDQDAACTPKHCST